MKPKLTRFYSPGWNPAITVVSALLALAPVHAATLNWDGADPGGTNDTASGGNGTWNTALLNWDDGVANSVNVAWSNAVPDSAVFGGAAGTVTLGAAITAGTVTFNTPGYILNNNGNALTAANLAGAGNFTKTGGGDFIITGGSTFTGGLTVTGGIVRFNNAVATTFNVGSLTTGNDVFINNGSTLQVNSGAVNFGSTGFWIQSTGTVGKITSGTGTLTVTNSVTDYLAVPDQAIRVQIVDGPSAVQLVKNGAGNLRIDKVNTYTGGTLVNTGRVELQTAGTLGTGAVTIASGAQMAFLGNTQTLANNFTIGGLGPVEPTGQFGALRFNTGNVNVTTLSGTITLTADTRIAADSAGVISGAIGGAFGIEKTRTGTVAVPGNLTFSGANTYTGATTVSGGSLLLDYSTQDNSKLSDTAALTLAHGTTLQLAGATGTHAETIGSFSSSGVASIVRTGANTTTIGLGNFTNNGILNIGAAGLATTTKANNASGYLTGVVLGGTDLGTNSGGNIVAFTGYNDVTRLASGAKVITSGAGTVTRIQEGTGAAANITIAAGTTDIQTLLQTATGATTVDLTGGTLRLGASGEILSGTGSGALTIQGGTLTAGGALDTPGQIFIGSGGSNAITVSSAISDNGTGAVSLKTSGTTTISGDTNTYTGGTSVVGGTLTVSSTAAVGAKTTLGTGAITVDNGNLRFLSPGTGNAHSYANDITLTNSTLTSEDSIMTFGGNVTLNGANSIDVVYNDKRATITGNVTGAGSLNKLRGDLILTGNNNYTGGTILSGGNLEVGSTNAIGTTGAITFLGGTLRYSAANTTDYSSRFGTNTNQAYSVDTNGQNVTWASGLTSANGSLAKFGAGTLTLTGTNTYNGATFIRNGTVSVGSIANNLGTATSSITLGTSAAVTGTLLYTGAGETTARGLTLNGNGVVTNNGSGLLKFNGGVNNTAGSGTQSLTLGGTNNGEIAGVISNNGATATTSLIKNDAGTWTLSGINTYTGGTTVNNGVLNLNNGGPVGAIRGTVTVNNTGVLRLSANDSTGYTVATALNVINLTNGGTLNVNTTTNQTLGSAVINMTGGNITGIAGSNLDFFGGASALNTLASATTSVISGVAISPLRQGNTTFTVADGAAAVDLRVDSVLQTSPAGDAAGGVFTKAGAGLMQLTATNTFARNIAITGGTLELAGAGLLGGGTFAQNISNAGAFISNSTANQTLSGVVSGAGTFVKSNSSVLTLSGANLYTGATTVSGGTLLVTGSLANTTTTVQSGGTLGGGGTIGGFTTIQSGGRLSPGTSPGITTFTNGLALAAGSNLDWELNANTNVGAGTSFDQVSVTGGNFTLISGSVLNLAFSGTVDFTNSFWDTNQQWTVLGLGGTATDGTTGTALTLGTITGGAGSYLTEGTFSVTNQLGSQVLVWTAVPEPSVALLGGLGALALLRRRRQA